MERTEEMLLFSILHILYDSVTDRQFQHLVHQVLDSMGHGLDLGAHQVADDMVRWLYLFRHCRYHWRRSDATQLVQDLLYRLTDRRRQMLFLALVLCGCNHRRCYQAWYAIACAIPDAIVDWTFAMDCTLLRLVEDVLLGERWLAMPRQYPVSAATAYRAGIGGGAAQPATPGEEPVTRQQRLIRKVALEVLYIFAQLRQAAEHLPASLRGLSRISVLQRMMFARYLQCPLEEQWTHYSGKYVPTGHSPSSLADCFLDRLATMPALAALLEWAVGEEASRNLYTPDHIEHMACEYRKFKDGTCVRRRADSGRID